MATKSEPKPVAGLVKYHGLLAAIRNLVKHEPTLRQTNPGRFCPFCRFTEGQGHSKDCPWGLLKATVENASRNPA